MKTSHFLLSLFIFLVSCSPFDKTSLINLSGSDGVFIDDKGTSNSLTETQTIEWKVNSEVQSKAVSYEISLGSQSKQNDVVDWINIGTLTSYKFSQSLAPHAVYYVNLRYVKLDASKSEIYSSAGFTTPADYADQISLGYDNSCVINRRGFLKCWGDNSYSQLGYEDYVNRGSSVGSMAALPKIDLGAERYVKSVSSGYVHKCAILDNNQLKCWGGNNSFGELGYDDTDPHGDLPGSMSSLADVDLGVDRTAKSISLGNNHTCAILDNDQLKCWGRNNQGQLGYDDALTRGSAGGSMAALPAVNLGSGRSAQSISGGANHTCAILDNNQLKCWGNNSFGQLGYDDSTARGRTAGSMAALPAINLGSGRTAKMIVLGGYHSCAILDNDELKCWGRNTDGQLGYDDVTARGRTAGSMAALPAINLGSGRTAKMIALGGYHSCAILDNDQLKCWGSNIAGQLGYDDKINKGSSAGSMSSLIAIDLGAGRTAKKIAATWNHTCAVLDNNNVKCWGLNTSGQLGHDDVAPRGISNLSMSNLGYVNLGIGHTSKDLSLGEEMSCSILDNDFVKCWGRNFNGQLGYGDINNRGDFPGSMNSLGYVDLGVGRTVKKMSSGRVHHCAILDNDLVKCWGGYDGTPLGNEDNLRRGDTVLSMSTLGTVNLGEGRTAQSISSGANHNCAILDNDQVKCWGDGSLGQLGYEDGATYGNTTGSMVSLGYVNLGAGRTAKSISLGQHHTCVILDNDQLKCWGFGYFGELGYGNNFQVGLHVGSMASLGYVNVGAGRTVKQIAGGEEHTCAILDNDQVKCWGTGSSGQLGYDDTINRNSPPAAYVNLGVGRTAKMIQAGSYHTCAILDNDQLKCWGASTALGYDENISRGDTAGSMALLPHLNLGVGRTAKSISLGKLHTCVVLDNNQVKCWGVNSGQLGYDDTITRFNGFSITREANNLYVP